MKKLLALILALCMVLALCACGKTEAPAAEQPAAEAPAAEEPAAEAPAAEEPAAEEPADAAAKSEGVMTYEEYVAAAIDQQVVIETYVQSKQTWWDNKVTVYTQDPDGAYFLYNMECAEEDYDKLVPGQKIKVTGYKAEWAGEIEVADATFEVVEGSWTAPVTDVTGILGTDEFEASQNKYVAFKGMVVESVSYKNGEPGDDIYVTMSKDGVKYDFCVEAYNWTTTPDSEFYASVGELKAGDVVDVEGFLYWYYGPNAHMTAVAVTGSVNEKSEGVMTYEEFVAAAIDEQVVIETYVQNTQTWWDNAVTAYTQDVDGGYFLYNMACAEEDYAKLVPGQKIKVTGYKAEWAGEIEIADATFEIVEGSYIAPAVDVTGSLDNLEASMNTLVTFTDMTVEAIEYKNGEPGDDIYVTLSKDGTSYSFCVECYCATTTPDSELYAAVGQLKAGDVVDVTGFLYWYNGANTHITAITVK